MILGIGCDICDIRRIEKILQSYFKEKFINRVFCQSEIDRTVIRKNLESSFAKIFSAKESVVKALGCTEGISWKDIEIMKDYNGKPYVCLHGNANLLAQKKCNSGRYNIHLSISDDHPYALSYVVFEQLN